LAQKWRQIRLAWALEARWSKAEILEAYLNLVTFRGELQGVAAAAGALFGKAPHRLTDAEGVTLAALLPAPNPDARALILRAAGRPRLGGGAAGAGPRGAVARAGAAPRGVAPRVALAPPAAARLLTPPRSARATVEPVRSTLDGDVQRVAVEALRRQLLLVRA